MYIAGSTNLIEDGFYDAGQIRPNTKFMSIEDYLKQELNDKRPILFIIAKAEYVTSKPINLMSSESQCVFVEKAHLVNVKRILFSQLLVIEFIVPGTF